MITVFIIEFPFLKNLCETFMTEGIPGNNSKCFTSGGEECLNIRKISIYENVAFKSAIRITV